MQFPPELRGSQQFPATPGLLPASQLEQQLTGPWVGSAQAVNGVLNPYAPPAPVGAMPTLPSTSMAPQLAQEGGGFLAAPMPPTPPQPVGSCPPLPLPVAPSSSVTPWVQTVPQAMPWGTYPSTTTTNGAPQLMRFSAGDQPTWAVNERRFRKRYLAAFGPEPPRKQAITEEKIAAQLSDLSLDGVLSSPPPPSASGKDSEEKRLHVLCPELEAPPRHEPLLPQPVLDDLRKRATMAVVLWQPLGPPTADKASGEDKAKEEEDKAEPSQRETKEEEEEEEASMEL